MRSPELRLFPVTLTLTFSVQGHLKILVNLCVLSSFSVTLISTDSIPCIGIDLDEMSLNATFPCDPDLDVFCSRSLNNFG